MKLSPELEEICTCNNLDHTILNYYCPANENEDEDLVGEWAGFNPYEDTCLGCGGQKTPEWPGYGPDGPENGNCAQELPECDVDGWFLSGGSPCPVCGDYTLYSDAPKNAPDFLCRDCHDEKMSDDAEWRDQTLVRKSSDLVDYADGDQFLIALDLYTSCPNECGEKYIPILYEAIEGHDPMYILGCGKCGFLDDDWDPKYVYEKEDGQIIKYYRESSDFDVVPMHPSLRNAEDIDYEDIEDQAVMFDVLNMVEANDLWNELMLELIARGDAVRRPDGKIIFTDQAPGYDIIEDIAEYTSPQFEFNADGDIK